MLSSSDVSKAWDLFKDFFHSVLDVVAPIKEIRLKQRTEPWLTSDILQNIQERDNWLNKFRKTRDPDSYKVYCNLWNEIQRETWTSKLDYLANKIDENRNNSKKLCQQLKNLGYGSKGKQSSNIVLDIDVETCFDSKKVANCFNIFSTSIATSMVEKLPPSLNLFDTRCGNFQNFYRNRNVLQYGFVLTSINEDFIFKELCQLNSSKSTGSDNILARFVKDAASILTKPITQIVNLSIQTGIVPRSLKNARGVPLFKKNNRSDVSNYRPVSVLSVVSKILEKAVYVQQEGYLAKKKKKLTI